MNNFLLHNNLMTLLLEVCLTFVLIGEIHSDFEKLGMLRISIGRSYKSVKRSVVLMNLLLGKPLEGEGGPVERMQEQEVVVVGGLLLPDLVLLVYYHLLLLVELFRHYDLLIIYSTHPLLNMHSPIKTIKTQLSIQKALEFVGDNSSYQKKRLIIIASLVLALAILTTRMALEPQSVSLLFLIASGAGQIVCPIYLSLRTNALGVGFASLLAMGLYPMTQFLRAIGLMTVGFFTRGFFVSGLIYLNQIGGDRFRRWSILVIFQLWALSTLFNSFDNMLGLDRWQIYYFCIFLPCLVGSFYMVNVWQPSPLYLYFKKMFEQTKYVLNSMAKQNERPFLPYQLEGEQSQEDHSYRRPAYKDLLNKDLLRKITVPLTCVWVYRQYIYYASTMMIPQVGNQHSRIYILVSVSQTVAVLLSYPIGKHVKRVNSIAATIIVVLIVSLSSSFARVPLECGGKGCFTKTLYFLTIMMIRFAMSLLGLILINYTLEIYPSNLRRMGFSVCLALSSLGSICMPWINSTLISLGLSGFISFAFFSVLVLFVIPLLEETLGMMRVETLQQLQNSKTVALRNWARLDFQ